MTYRRRKLLAILVLVLGLPGYIAVAWVAVSALDRPPFLLEVAVYVGLGVIWALPFRRLFLGLGRPDPEARSRTERRDEPGER